VKSLLFIIVVIVYLQYLEERERERSGKKKEVFFCRIHYSPCKPASHYAPAIISAIIRVSIAVPPLSSSFLPETREGEVLAPK